MSYTQDAPRDQSPLFPDVIDTCLTEDNPVRLIDAFVDSLYFEELGFHRPQPALTGGLPYDPGHRLKHKIYGYLNHVRSSHRLEKETHYVFWK